MMHHDGEVAVARAAARAGVPYTLSAMGTTSIEEVAAAAPDGRRWFQLYRWKDRAAISESRCPERTIRATTRSSRPSIPLLPVHGSATSAAG